MVLVDQDRIVPTQVTNELNPILSLTLRLGLDIDVLISSSVFPVADLEAVGLGLVPQLDPFDQDHIVQGQLALLVSFGSIGSVKIAQVSTSQDEEAVFEARKGESGPGIGSLGQPPFHDHFTARSSGAARIGAPDPIVTVAGFAHVFLSGHELGQVRGSSHHQHHSLFLRRVTTCWVKDPDPMTVTKLRFSSPLRD